MSYMVLARRWRPRTFAEMTGQEHVTKTLSNALKTGRVAHAYLFHGPRGVGKTTAARILAKAINCEHGVGAEPCNQCAVCTAINQGTSLDVVEMDGASNRGIDEIRELREHVGYAPVTAGRKVYIIDEVHMLTEQAFNALLKTLEEPPEHVVFIFATTEVHKVPATILSRCQRFEFRRIPQSDVVKRLSYLAQQEGVQVDERALLLMARRAEGCLRDAESLLDQASAAQEGVIDEAMVRQLLGLSPADQLSALLDAVAVKDLAATMRQLDDMMSGGMELDRIVTDLADLMLELVRARLESVRDAATEAGSPRNLEPADLLRGITVLQSALQAARHSARPGPILESAVLRMALMDKTVAIEQVLEALGRTPHDAPEAAPPVASAVPPKESPPASGQPPAEEPLILEGAWRRLSASTKSFVVRATQTWREDTVVLAFRPEDGFAATAMERADRRAEVERALEEAAGRPIRLEIVAESSPKAVTSPVPPAPQEDPLVKDIIRRFDGLVVETRLPREETISR